MIPRVAAYFLLMRVDCLDASNLRSIASLVASKQF